MDLFDGHCDTISRAYEHGGGIRHSDGHLDLNRTRKYRRYGQFFALFADAAQTAEKTLWQIFQAQYALFMREMEGNSDLVAFCRNGDEADAAFAAGKTAAFLAVEGAELLECSVARLEQAWDMGVRCVNLTWNNENALSGTNAQGAHKGLTAQGRAFTQRAQALGILVDVSHLSEPGFWDVVEIATRPIIATHSNAKFTYFDARNLTDEQITAIIKNHGLAGLNLYGGFLSAQPALEDVIAHLEHVLSLGGESNIGLGGDWDGFPDDCLPRGISGIQDMDKLYEALLRRNYTEELVRGVFFNNMQRVVNEVCGM